MLEALEDLHSVGYLHRDVKPDNYSIGRAEKQETGKIYLLDFGMARKYVRDDVSAIPICSFPFNARHLISPRCLERHPSTTREGRLPRNTALRSIRRTRGPGPREEGRCRELVLLASQTHERSTAVDGDARGLGKSFTNHSRWLSH